MFQNILILISIFSFVQSLTQNLYSICKQANYTYNVLALTWPKQFCESHTCKQGWQKQWDKKSFTLHGYWPNTNDIQSTLACYRDYEYDPYCNVDFSYNQKLFSRSLLNQLNSYWIQLKSHQNIHAHEWSKHGTCYIYNMIYLKKEKISKKGAFIFYFQNLINLAKEYQKTITKKQYETKNELGFDLNLLSNQFYAFCGDDNQLDEIRICYSIKQKYQSQENIISCPESYDKNLCKFPIIMNGFE